ncbi:MAG: hypothetical protein ACP5LW_04915 [Nitrososphaeria archaeon]
MPDLKACYIRNGLIQAEENAKIKDIVKLIMEKRARNALVNYRATDYGRPVEHVLFGANNLSLLAKIQIAF